MKGGIGTASFRRGDLVIAALTVVNAAGDIVDWRTGRIVAGARTADGHGFADSMAVLRAAFNAGPIAAVLEDAPFRSTTLTLVATNVALDKTRLDTARDDDEHRCGAGHPPVPHRGRRRPGLCRINGQDDREIPVTIIAAIAADLVASSILRAVTEATGVDGWTAARA